MTRIRELVRGLALVSIAGGATPAAGTPVGDDPPVSDLAMALEYVGVAVSEPDYTIWGAAPIQDGAGRVHLFVARWPEANVDPAWRRSSEIAHYVGPGPEGPFEFRDVALTGSGREGAWDRYAAHNPEIRRFGERYALLYIANDDYRQPPHPRNQAIGMALSDSLDGPWHEVNGDGLLLGPSAEPTHWTHGQQVVNPTLVQVGQRFHLYFKSRDGNGGTTRYGLAVAERLEGPYRMTDAPLTEEGVFLEDGSAFLWEDEVCLLTTDNRGHVTGIPGGGTLWVSRDGGFSFPTALAQVGYDHLTTYEPSLDPDEAHRVYGGAPKLERPKVLCIDGRPAYLYGPSGWALHGGERTAAYVLRIDLEEGAGPLAFLGEPRDPDSLARPTPAQLAWQEAELGVVFHYDIHVFDDRHYVQDHNRRNGALDPEAFQPTELDTDQWVRVAKDMGARFAILTASHETGFRLWQSDANPYCLKATSWGRGERDIVGEFVASCRAQGIAPGIYLGTRWNAQLGVWDFRVTDRSPLTQAEYNALIEAEVEEITSRYGPLFELWFDGGAHGPAQGGPDVQAVFERNQPDCLFYHNHDRADARWGGTESGTVPYPCWARMPFPGSGGPGKGDLIRANGFRLLKHGAEDGTVWCPAMSDAPLRHHEWFWDAGDEHKLHPLERLVEMYYGSVGRNSTLILGLTPDDRGLVPAADAARCKELGDAIRRIFRHRVGTISGRGDEVVLTLDGPRRFDHVVLQEDVREGERVREYVVELREGEAWVEVARGTCIGHKRIHSFSEPRTASELRLRLLRSVAEPRIRSFELYDAP